MLNQIFKFRSSSYKLIYFKIFEELKIDLQTNYVEYYKFFLTISTSALDLPIIYNEKIIIGNYFIY